MDKKASSKNKNNDMMLKVIAVICALFLWFYAEAQENPSKERQLTVPIQYVNMKSDYVVEHANQSVQVTIKGNETDIMSLRSDDFTAVVDLTDAVEGSESYPVQVIGNAATERFSYTPEHVRVSIAQMTQKEVPVRVRTDGDVAQYYELQHVDVQPNTVTIRGASKVLEEITGIETNVIDISELQQDIEVSVFLQLPENIVVQNGDGSVTTEKQITVALHVQPLQEEKTVEAEIELRNVPEGTSAILDVTKVALTLRGDATLLESQNLLGQISLYVDCATLTEGQYLLPIQIETVQNSVQEALRSVTPQTVTVTITADESAITTEGNGIGTEIIGEDHVNEVQNNHKTNIAE